MIDYGIGNLLSVERAFRHLGADFKVAETAADIRMADKLVLPGVGAFSSCIGTLEAQGLCDAVKEAAEQEKPLLGICVGMQMLFDTSEEFGVHQGLGLLKGRVKAIPAVSAEGQSHKIPHIGWTSLILPEGRKNWEQSLLRDVPVNAEVYFVHSYTAYPVDSGDRLADAEYDGCLLSAMVNRGNVYGIQFHPEKSGTIGLKILDNFVKL